MAKTSKASTAAKAIRIASDLRIAGARATFEALLAAAQGPEPRIALDARQVDKADAAGLQALLAGRQALLQANKSVTWTGCSEPLSAAAALLGLSAALGLPQ